MTKRTNEQWLLDLRAGDSRRETALVDLRAEILHGLPYALRDWLSPDDPQFTALAEDATQETLMRALKNLDSFEGRSQFTTYGKRSSQRGNAPLLAKCLSAFGGDLRAPSILAMKNVEIVAIVLL